MAHQAQWKPNATVAAIVERDGRFLLVEEQTSAGLMLNQPAGHWEQGETLLAATRREAYEETGWHVEPTALVGIYAAPKHDEPELVYLRFAFVCTALDHDADAVLDDGIVRPLWLTAEEIAASVDRQRSSLVHRCVQDYLAGRRYPLDLLTHVGFPPDR